MSENHPESGTKSTKPSRDERLKAALKANMARRKAQARSRAQTQAEQARNEGK